MRVSPSLPLFVNPQKVDSCGDGHRFAMKYEVLEKCVNDMHGDLNYSEKQKTTKFNMHLPMRYN